MSGDSRGYALDISEHLFHLTTESLRLRSNETKRYQTLASLVNSRVAFSCKMEEHDPEIIRDHLVTIPTKGDIRIYLSISRSSADSLVEAKKRLGSQIGSNLTVGDALSILLFDYVVEQKATRVLERLGLDEPKGKCAEANANESQDENVVRLK